MDASVRAYIGLGGNLGDAVATITQALAALRAASWGQWVGASSLYRSRPLGGLDQPDYINAVAALDTTLSAPALLAQLQRLEQQAGRRRSSERWCARTLDLDLLLYGEAIIDHPALTVPHPGLAVRAFVLYPLAQIAPEQRVPGQGRVSDLLATCPQAGLERLEVAS